MGYCRRWIAVGMVLMTLACGAASRPVRAAEALPHVTLNLKRAPIDEVLRALFRDTPYSFELAPGDYARVTISLDDAPWAEALRAVLDMEGLTATIEGNLYHIAGRGSGAKAPPATPPAAKPVHTMLYLSPYGDRTQLCLRQFPYPGHERVLWESRPGERVYYYLPSPSFDRVVVVTEDRRLVLFVADGGEQSVLLTSPYLFWKDDHELIALDFDQWQDRWVEGVYDVDRAALTPTGTPSSAEAALQAHFADPIRAVTDLENSGARLGVDLEDKEVPDAVLGGTGMWWGHDLRLPRPVAAVAPDGKHFALTYGKETVVVITQTGERSYAVSRAIPSTQLLKEEAVRFQHLRWSPDSKHLTFTETHFYPAQYYAEDIGLGYKVPTNVTSLVRLYDAEKDDVQTVVIGGNAFLAAEGVELEHGR